MERIMLVVWKWRDFQRKGHVVNRELLSQEKYQDAITQIDTFENELYDTYLVCDQKPDGTTPAAQPKTTVVRTFVEKILNDTNAPPFQYLKQLISHLKTPDNTLFVFLHRRDGFGDEEVSAILKDGQADKCFLIGDGRDNIYYRDIRNQGLLGDDGYFFRRESSPGRSSISIANNKEKIVFLNHFNKIWAYYRHEFHTKIFELKEDLLSHFYSIYPDDIQWSKDQYADHLLKDEILSLRVRSFIDDSVSNGINDPDSRALDQYGKSVGKSYEFDDIRANLVSLRKVEIEYTTVSTFLFDLFLNKEAEQAGSSLNEMLKTMENQFSELLYAIGPSEL